jgi:hypothetical protein
MLDSFYYLFPSMAVRVAAAVAVASIATTYWNYYTNHGKNGICGPQILQTQREFSLKDDLFIDRRSCKMRLSHALFGKPIKLQEWQEIIDRPYICVAPVDADNVVMGPIFCSVTFLILQNPRRGKINVKTNKLEYS